MENTDIANNITIIVKITIYIYSSVGYKVLPFVSIFASETHVTGENLVKPVHVFVTTICHNTSNVVPIAPADREMFKFKTNMHMPKKTDTIQQLKKAMPVALSGVYALYIENSKGIVILCWYATLACAKVPITFPHSILNSRFGSNMRIDNSIITRTYSMEAITIYIICPKTQSFRPERMIIYGWSISIKGASQKSRTIPNIISKTEFCSDMIKENMYGDILYPVSMQNVFIGFIFEYKYKTSMIKIK